MTHYAIIEQAKVAASTKLSASKVKVPKHTLVYKSTYASDVEFKAGLQNAIRSLHELADDLTKVLIISAHGIPQTGTHLEASDNEQILLWNYRDLFTVMPKNLVVYVSACFGGYPAVGAIQSAQLNKPYVIGPLVDIESKHANEIQCGLLDLVKSDISCKRLYHLIRRFNNERNIKNQEYGGRNWLIGMYDTCGNFFPRRAIGNQLAAPVESKMNFSITELVRHDDTGTAIGCIFKNDHDEEWQANLPPLLHLAESEDDLIGKRFSAKYQIQNEEDSLNAIKKRIHILKAKKR